MRAHRSTHMKSQEHFTLHSTLYTAHFTLYSLHSTIYTPHTSHTPHSTHPTHSTDCTLYTPHVTLYTPHFTHYTLRDSTFVTFMRFAFGFVGFSCFFAKKPLKQIGFFRLHCTCAIINNCQRRCVHIVYTYMIYIYTCKYIKYLI